jgi:hypothetical protein
MKTLKCPKCKSRQYCRFVFVEVQEAKRITRTNPSDYAELFLCPYLHVFDTEGQLVTPEPKAS